MSTTSTPIPEQEIPTEKPPGDAVARLYKYSTWVHVGAGAEECPDAETGACADALHFHAWCRLPNPYQLDDIRRRALAAKARRGRQLRDPETDSYAVLEDELDAIARRGDLAREECIEELCAKDWWDTYFAAANEVKQLEDDGETLTWAHITEDQERYGVLSAMASDDRPADEWGELVRRLAAYQQAVEERFDELLKPLRDSLNEKDISALIDLVRDQRIDVDCGREFITAYAAQCWLACTYTKPTTGAQTWDSYGALYVAAPEVLAAVKEAFEDLQRTEQEARGN